MYLSKFLRLAFIVSKTTIATDIIADFTPPWLFGTGSGVIQTILVPTTKTLTKISYDVDDESSSDYIASFQL